MTEKTQQKIINKALGKINNQLFIAVITETKHPKDAIKVSYYKDLIVKDYNRIDSSYIKEYDLYKMFIQFLKEQVPIQKMV